MKKTKQLLIKFVVFMVFIFAIGITGWLVPYGDAKWNFFFESLMFFPVELIITVFIINKLLEKVETERAFTDYYDIAEVALTDVQHKLKGSMILGHTGRAVIHQEEYDSRFENLSIKFDDYII